MGRYVYDSNGEFVWKYVFGEQASEQSRIAEELGIGEVEEDDDSSGDVLKLNRDDIKKLKDYLNATIKIDFLGHTFEATRIECVKHWNNRFNGEESYRYNGFADNVNNLINNLMNEDLHFWSMINRYIEHMEELDCDWIEFYGEY